MHHHHLEEWCFAGGLTTWIRNSFGSIVGTSYLKQIRSFILADMWRVATMLCLAVAAGKYTAEQLDEMSTSMKAAAEKLQSQVVSLGKEITPLAAKIPLIPAEIAQAQGQEDAEAKVLAVLEKEKATMVKICKLYDSMQNLTNDINSEFTKAGSVAKEVQDQMTEMAKDTDTNQDGQKLQFYLDKIQSTIMALDRANSGGRSYLSPVATGICKAETQEELLHVGVPASRLFLALKPPDLPKFFHLPSVLVGVVFGAIVVGAATLSLVRSKKTSLMESLEWLPRRNRIQSLVSWGYTRWPRKRPTEVGVTNGHHVQSNLIISLNLFWGLDPWPLDPLDHPLICIDLHFAYFCICIFTVSTIFIHFLPWFLMSQCPLRRWNLWILRNLFALRCPENAGTWSETSLLEYVGILK